MKNLIIAFCCITIISCGDSGSDGNRSTGPLQWVIDAEPLLSPLTSPSWMKWQTDPCVIIVDGLWIMYFGTNDEGVLTQIGRATSPDGINWVRDTSGPVLPVGPTDAWDDTDVETPWVIYDPTALADKRYKMWYSGNGNAGDNRPEYTYQVGYAYSADRINWTKYNNISNDADPRFAESDPVLPIPAFVSNGSGGFDPSDLSNSVDAWTTGEPSVLRMSDGSFRIYYIGLGLDSATMAVFEHRVSVAVSTDGFTWTKQGVVFESDHSTYESTGIMCPAVVIKDGSFYLFYTMIDRDFSQFANIERGYTGLAVSSDGINFTRTSSEPVLNHGPEGSYFMSGAYAATPVINDSVLYLYFSGVYFTESPAVLKFHIGRASYSSNLAR